MYQAMTLCDLPWPIIKNLKCTLRNFHISDALLYHTPPSPIGKFIAVITGIKLLVLNGKICQITNCKTKLCPKNLKKKTKVQFLSFPYFIKFKEKTVNFGT